MRELVTVTKPALFEQLPTTLCMLFLPWLVLALWFLCEGLDQAEDLWLTAQHPRTQQEPLDITEAPSIMNQQQGVQVPGYAVPLVSSQRTRIASPKRRLAPKATKDQ